MATWKNKPPLPKNVEVILTCHNGLKVTNWFFIYLEHFKNWLMMIFNFIRLCYGSLKGSKEWGGFVSSRTHVVWVVFGILKCPIGYKGGFIY